MTDPITLAIAAAAAGKAVEVTGGAAKDAVTTIVGKIRERFRGRPADEAVLAAATADPDSPERVGELAAALRRAMSDDPAFDTELRTLWGGVDASAHDDGVVNIFQGNAETSVQMRDVHGDLHIG